MGIGGWFVRRNGSFATSPERLDEAAFEPLEPRLLLNAAPEIVSLELSAAAIGENDSVTVTATFTDDDPADTHFMTFDWGDGSAAEMVFFAQGRREVSHAHQYLDDDPSGTASDPVTISVTVDDGTDSDTDSVALTVDNVAPALTALDLDSPAIDESGTANLSGSFTDPGTLDAHTVEIDWGDGSAPDVFALTIGERTFQRSHQYLNDPAGASDEVTIDVTLTDDDTGEDTDQTTVTVTNVAPAITGLALDFSVIDEDGTVNLSGSFTDPGTLDTHTVEIDWGDGSAADVTTLAVGERTFEASHQYLDDDPSGTPSDDYQIGVTLSDDGGGSDSAGTTVTVNNVDPDIGALVLDSLVIDENDTATLTGTFTDPGTLDAHTVEIDWGDGSAADVTTLAVGERTFQASHQYLDDDPTGTPSDDYTITVTVTDDDTGEDTDGTTITVDNVPPVIGEIFSSAPGVGDAAEGEDVTVWGAFTDVGTLDTHTGEVDWGDGTVTPAVIDETGGSGTFTATHAYEFGGIYTVTVTVTDDDTGADVETTSAVITGAGVHDGALQIIGSREGDRAKVNQQGNGLTKVHASFLTDRGRHRTFDSETIERIEILLGDGDDRAQISGNVDLPALIDGGAGNDHMKAGRGPAVLLGEEGNDKLIGGKGNDVLIGGEGKDRLVGGPGDDILIGGTTAFDVNDDALTAEYNQPLLAILAEWSSERDFDTRVANLNGTGTGERLNEDYFLQEDVTVFDDGVADRLTGSSGMLWVIEPLDAKALQRMARKNAREMLKAAKAEARQLQKQARAAAKSDDDALTRQLQEQAQQTLQQAQAQAEQLQQQAMQGTQTQTQDQTQTQEQTQAGDPQPGPGEDAPGNGNGQAKGHAKNGNGKKGNGH